MGHLRTWIWEKPTTIIVGSKLLYWPWICNFLIYRIYWSVYFLNILKTNSLLASIDNWKIDALLYTCNNICTVILHPMLYFLFNVLWLNMYIRYGVSCEMGNDDYDLELLHDGKHLSASYSLECEDPMQFNLQCYSCAIKGCIYRSTMMLFIPILVI